VCLSFYDAAPGIGRTDFLEKMKRINAAETKVIRLENNRIKTNQNSVFFSFVLLGFFFGGSRRKKKDKNHKGEYIDDDGGKK